MQKMLQEKILDYTSIIFMTLVFISLYYFRISNLLYGLLLFMSFFPYFFKLYLNQKEEVDIFCKGKKMPLMAFLLTNFIIFIIFISSIIYGCGFLINSFLWLLLPLSFYLHSKEYNNSFMMSYHIVLFFSIVICLYEGHSLLEVISYMVYMYIIISKFGIKSSDKYLSKSQE